MCAQEGVEFLSYRPLEPPGMGVLLRMLDMVKKIEAKIAMADPLSVMRAAGAHTGSGLKITMADPPNLEYIFGGLFPGAGRVRVYGGSGRHWLEEAAIRGLRNEEMEVGTK